MADYYGVCDNSGNVLGHSMKALREYSSILSKEHDVYAAVSPCIYKTIHKEHSLKMLLKQVDALHYDILETEGYDLARRVADKFRLFANIRQIYQKLDHFDTVWFYRTDFFLFLYIFLHRKPKHCHIAYLIYQDHFTGGKLEGLLQFVYRRALAKADLIICTGSANNTKAPSAKQHDKLCYMPDFTYDADIYRKYCELPKEDKCVCTGTMNPYKQLEEMVDVFCDNGRRLVIAGPFYDHERAWQLFRKSAKNISVEDTVLTEDEYLKMLGSARYAILPYDMKQYEGRTSGVLQECMFLKTIPVAPEKLLKDNKMPGLGYDTLEDLRDNSFFESADNSIYSQMSDYCDSVDFERVSSRLLKMFGGLAGTHGRKAGTD